MADQPISGLTALTGANTATGDLLEIVDVSDTTMAATGTNKKITRDEMKTALLVAPGPIGGTTPAAGSFTTLTTTTEANGISALGGAGVSKRANVLIQGTNASSASKISYVGVNAWGTDGSLEIMSGTGTTKIGEGGTGYATVSSTGLAVTGAITATTTGKVGTTLGVGGATPSASGAGITFPATQSASTDPNTLDDYEEGTWTPVLYYQDATGVTRTYTAQTGTYTKSGNTVTVAATVTGATSNSGSYANDNIGISGLPFSAAGVALLQVLHSGFAGSATVGAIVAQTGTTITYFLKQSSTAGNLADDLGAGATYTLYLTGTYRV